VLSRVSPGHVAPLLQPEQEDLLVILVEATRNLLPGQREQFMFLPTAGDSNSLCHPGLPGGEISAYDGDLDVLSNEGLINRTWGGRSGDWYFDVTPRGFAVYEAIKRRAGAPVRQIEEELTRYLDAEVFQERYPEAYRKWSEATEKLWSSEPEQQLTTIGHLCREAIQEFATALVERHKPREVDQDKAHDIARVTAVLDQHATKFGTRVSSFLDALVAYWRTVSGLVQRQEHGRQKEDRPLVCEDGRRVVFQTAIVMFEIDRALERGRSAATP
jgi:hypothetical protein